MPNQYRPNDDSVARRRMVEEQIRGRGVTDERVLDAMMTVPRELFVPRDCQDHAFEDRALCIGEGQTISQPFIVAYMTERLSVPTDARVLEIGTGTGYQTAILARLARHLYSVERISGLHERARRALAALGITNISLHLGDGTLGWAEHAPYDRILVTAAAPRVSEALVDQLVDGGRLVLPVGGETGQTISTVIRKGSRTVETPSIACRFVRLRGVQGWNRADR